MSTAKRRLGDSVTFSIVDEAEVKAGFSGRRPLKSKYREALEILIASGDETKVARFDSPSARFSVATQAKKLGVKVLFAEQGGKIYVKIAPPTSRTPATASKPLPKLEHAVLTAIREKPRSNGEILHRVKEMGVPADNTTLITMLGSLRNNGSITKSDDDLCWHITEVRQKVGV